MNTFRRPFTSFLSDTLCAVAALAAVACGAEPDEMGGAAEHDDPGLETAESRDGEVAMAREPLSTVTGTRPLLVILLRRDATTPLARDDAWYAGRIFGPAFPNVVDQVEAISKGRFLYARAGVLSVTDRMDTAFLTRAGVTSTTGSTLSTRLRSLMLADDAGFPFEQYDTNADGRVTTSELAVLTIDNYSVSSGQDGGTPCVAHPGSIHVCTRVALAGHQSNTANYVHELLHQLGTQDVYGTGCHGSRQSVMSCTSGGVEGEALYDIDPWQRWKLGWTGREDTVAGQTGSAVLQPVATYADTRQGVERLVVERGTNQEKLLIEYRKRDGYDRDVAIEGISFWHVKEQSDGLRTVGLPQINGSGQDNANFLLQPVACIGDPMNPSSRGRTGLGTAPDSSYRFKWLDGTDTGFLFSIGAADAQGTVVVSWERSSRSADCPQAPRIAGEAGFAHIAVSGGSAVVSDAFGSGQITAQRRGLGDYRVEFTKDPQAGGAFAIVNAIGADNTRCNVAGVTSLGAVLHVDVACHAPTGNRADSSFVVQYGVELAFEGAFASVFASAPTLPSYLPQSRNSTFNSDRIVRTGVGAYDVFFTGLGANGGNVQVTAYGQSTASHCKVLSWGASWTDQRVRVRCFGVSNTALDSAFMLVYRGPSEAGFFGDGAYTWASEQTLSWYMPATAWSYTSAAVCPSVGTNTLGRTGVGAYFAQHSRFPLERSAATVTAHGTGSAYCKLASRPSAITGGVEVRSLCFDSTGAPADSKYLEAYAMAGPGPC